MGVKEEHDDGAYGGRGLPSRRRTWCRCVLHVMAGSGGDPDDATKPYKICTVSVKGGNSAAARREGQSCRYRFDTIPWPEVRAYALHRWSHLRDALAGPDPEGLAALRTTLDATRPSQGQMDAARRMIASAYKAGLPAGGPGRVKREPE